MTKNAKAAVLASFVADSLALGAHWIYDTAEIDEKIGRVENVMAGGDSAARGMAAAMILGAHGGPGAIPDAWLSGLSARDRIHELLQRIGGA